MDFMEDRARSGRFYIWSDCAVTLLEEIRRHLDLLRTEVATWREWCLAKRSVDAYDFVVKFGYIPRMNVTWPHTKANSLLCYDNHIHAFLHILGSVDLGKTTQTLDTWADFDFRRLVFFPSYPSPVRRELLQNVRNLHYVYASTDTSPSWIRG